MPAIEMIEKATTMELAPQMAQQAQSVAVQSARQPSVVEYAMQNGASAADVRALVELQIQMDNHKLAMLKQQDEREREQRKEAAELAFRRDFAAFRGENIIIPKTKLVEQQGRDGKAGPRFMQSEFDVVCARLSPALSRYGFGFRHDMKFGTREWPLPDNPHNVIGWVTVTCFLEHQGKHTETLTLEGPPDDSGRKNPLQEMQSTASYLKRQSLLAITGTATGGEDDENRFSKARTDTCENSPDERNAREALVNDGEAAAVEGMAKLTAWWGTLTAKQRADLSREFGNMRRVATKADQGVSHA
jgi:hypothetical protein